MNLCECESLVDRTGLVFLPLTVLAGVARLTGCALVASVSKALTGGREPVQKKKKKSTSEESEKQLGVTATLCCGGSSCASGMYKKQELLNIAQQGRVCQRDKNTTHD